MKVILLTDGIYPYVIGGMQKHSYYLCKYLAKNGVYVHLYHCSERSQQVASQLLDCFDGEEKKFISATYIPFPEVRNFPGHYIWASYLYSCKIEKALNEKNIDADVIYAKGFSGWRLFQKKKGNILPVTIANFHGYEMFQRTFSLKNRLESWLFQWPVRYNVRKADYVVSYGGEITTLVKHRLNISPNKILELPAGIEDIFFDEQIIRAGDDIQFCFIGRYERRKGIEELTEVLRNLVGKYAFSFHFIGAIPDNLKIQSKQVIYHGVIRESKKIKQILQSCDVLVCPSFAEGMPNVILEAMASGCAILATPVGAVPVMVSDENGWLVPAGNKMQLQKSIIDIVNTGKDEIDEKKRNSLRLALKKFSWNSIAKVTIDTFNQIIN